MGSIDENCEASLAMVGSERWLSVHLYHEKGDREVLLEVVPAVVRRLHRDGSIDSFFFVRYLDERGHHVRLRLRLLAAAQPCWDWILATAGERFQAVPTPFELELERYGGQDPLLHSLSFFAVSSAHALVFEREFGGLSRSRQMTLALCFLLWQAWGFAENETEFRALLGYYALGLELHPEMVTFAEETFRRSAGKLTELVRQELQRLLALADSAEVSLASASSLVAATRALSAALGDLDAEARWRVAASQMHMTANRLGLLNPQETFTSQVLYHTMDEIAASDTALWQRVRDAMERPTLTPGERTTGAAALRSLVRSHLAALQPPAAED
jgi:thiopeptide-type bacteriocin biosynthesis protein